MSLDGISLLFWRWSGRCENLKHWIHHYYICSTWHFVFFQIKSNQVLSLCLDESFETSRAELASTSVDKASSLESRTPPVLVGSLWVHEFSLCCVALLKHTAWVRPEVEGVFFLCSPWPLPLCCSRLSALSPPAHLLKHTLHLTLAPQSGLKISPSSCGKSGVSHSFQLRGHMEENLFPSGLNR